MRRGGFFLVSDTIDHLRFFLVPDTKKEADAELVPEQIVSKYKPEFDVLVICPRLASA